MPPPAILRALAIAVAGLALAGSCRPAHATLQVTVNGVSAGVPDPTNTMVAISYNQGGLIAAGTAYGETLLGVGKVDLSTMTVSATGAGTITIIVSENFLTGPVGQGTLSETLSAHFLSGSGSVSYTTYGSQANTLYSSTPVSNQPTVVATPTQTYVDMPSQTAFGGTTGSTFVSTNPYSITQVLTITFKPGGGMAALSSDASSQFALPEPSSVVMGLTGLPLLGLYLVRRARRRA